MIEADLVALEPSRFEAILDDARWHRFARVLHQARDALAGRTVFHVNSAMTGGGVAELLTSVLGYMAGAGICSKWFVLDGTDDFFVVTKRIHHLLHGKEGDGEGLGTAEADLYHSVLTAELPTLAKDIHPGDVVVLHDPQVAGLAGPLRDLGAKVIWNCHVGTDVPNDNSRTAWRFLLPSVRSAQAQVFSRSLHVWEGLDADHVAIIPPCIDAFSPKNQAMSHEQVDAILSATGIVDGEPPGEPSFVRAGGSRGRVRAATELIDERRLPPDAPLVTQVSRWDPLKDHAGLARAFADGVALELGAHLVLAGPAPDAVADDPEGMTTLDELKDCWASLPGDVRSRVHLACLPMDDVEENAAVVNALQRRSQVLVQKSLAEGFGLTVTEAMWKGRPTVASAVGGIQEQITDASNGLLVDDPEDHAAFGCAITSLLEDREAAAALGQAAQLSVMDNFLVPAYLARYLSLAEQVLDA